MPNPRVSIVNPIAKVGIPIEILVTAADGVKTATAEFGSLTIKLEEVLGKAGTLRGVYIPKLGDAIEKEPVVLRLEKTDTPSHPVPTKSFITIKTIPPKIHLAKVTKDKVVNGQRLYVVVSGEPGSKVYADFSEVDTKGKMIALTECRNEPGTFVGSYLMSKTNAMENGPKIIKFAVEDIAGNRGEDSLAWVTLDNPEIIGRYASKFKQAGIKTKVDFLSKNLDELHEETKIPLPTLKKERRLARFEAVFGPAMGQLIFKHGKLSGPTALAFSDLSFMDKPAFLKDWKAAAAASAFGKKKYKGRSSGSRKCRV
ncbi:MAG: hypothetical protein NPIRA03_06930 [Nitrospirales bacterium]|nr:MAG: hypothetical protein NPIRA03_06930 [Nitrospirales bacterium]